MVHDRRQWELASRFRRYGGRQKKGGEVLVVAGSHGRLVRAALHGAVQRPSAPPRSPSSSTGALPPSMPKPTIIQSLLHRPSQHYSFPAQKNYHSTKQELIRVATEADPSHRQHIASLTLVPPSQPYACPVPIRPERRRSRKRRHTLSETNEGSEDVSEVGFDAS